MAPKFFAGPDTSGLSGGGTKAPLSPLIHGRARLLILSFLLRTPRSHPFTNLRNQLGFTDGLLSANLGKLEAAGMVQLSRSFVGKKPQTLVKITPKGKREFQHYVAELKGIVPGLS
ncbi:MAG: transcriptional regulator [Candidatus Krumholzibacteria bacterium]|nr:transcriptional regulator [Candidatus Krumholzibacteria bacterium]